MADAVLAVDLGKTGCRAALFFDGRRFDAEGPGAPGLASAAGVVSGEAAVLAVASPLLRTAGVERVASVCVGAAGAMAAPGAARALAERLCASLPAEAVAVASDAVASHAGALAGGAGVVLAAGTGAVAMAVGPDGVFARVDGAGPRLGDEGSGGWLGMAGLRSALRSIERRGPPTALVDAAAARFGPVDGWAGLIEGHDHPAQLAAGFAPDIAAAAAMAGDAVAAGLIEQAAALLAESVAAAAGRIGGAGPIRFAAVGGLLGLGAGFVEALLARVRAAAPRLDFEAAAGSALDGARLLALDRGTIHEPRVIRAAASAGAAAAGLDLLATEGVRPGLDDLDERPPSAIVHLVLQSERAAQEALARAEPSLAAAAEGVAERMRLGGRLFTLGAGTPGRLAVLDAAELGPTFSAPPELVVALLAGGMAAMVVAVEGAEDDAEAAGRSLTEHGLSAGDAVVGITASGRTPYVVGGLRAARAVGALTVAIVNNAGGPAAGAAEMAVQILTGPELVAGSTRMSAGTTQKIALNAISTAAMIALGKTYGARMVDVRASNEKLRRRALRMVREITGAAEPEAAAALAAAGGRVKPAIVALLGGVGPAQAEALLDAAGGRARAAIAAAKA